MPASQTTRSISLNLYVAGLLVSLLFGLLPAVAHSAPQECKVHHIHDGDTLTLICGRKRMNVRLHCIDAPEMDQEPWGKRSRDHLATLIDGAWIERRGNLYPVKGVSAKLRAIETDSHGRTVGDVFNDQGENLNLALVRDGHAVVYDRYCRDDRFHSAEQKAKQAKLGVWKKRGLQQTPWTWRHRSGS